MFVSSEVAEGFKIQKTWIILTPKYKCGTQDTTQSPKVHKYHYLKKKNPTNPNEVKNTDFPPIKIIAMTFWHYYFQQEVSIPHIKENCGGKHTNKQTHGYYYL